MSHVLEATISDTCALLRHGVTRASRTNPFRRTRTTTNYLTSGEGLQAPHDRCDNPPGSGGYRRARPDSLASCRAQHGAPSPPRRRDARRVVVTGTVGYVLLGFSLLDALYQTITTITTVGFREVEEFGTAEKWFTIVVIVLGVGTVLYTFTTVVQFVVEGQFRELVGRKRMNRRIAEMSGPRRRVRLGRVGRAVDSRPASGRPRCRRRRPRRGSAQSVSTSPSSLVTQRSTPRCGPPASPPPGPSSSRWRPMPPTCT